MAIDFGGMAQDAIDNFIDLWITGVKTIFGDDATPEDAAPMPFYQAGTGYWFSYNDGVISSTAPASYGFSRGQVTWAVFTKDGDDRDIHVEFDVGGVEDTSRPAEWNSAVSNYWNKVNFPLYINDAYIINNQVDYFGLNFRADTADPSAVAGLRYTEQNVWYKDFIDGSWLEFDGDLHETASRLAIINNSDANIYYGNIMPISAYTLNLPRSNDSYWVSIGNSMGNETLINNYYDTIENHNENNQYLTDNNYNTYNNTYQITNDNGFTFNIDVGAGGFSIDVNGVGVGVGGAGAVLTGAPSLNFDDLVDILTPIVNDINDNSGSDTPVVIHDFEYYMGYEDMGDFYIEPLHQYDKIPAAPDFDGTIDFGNYPAFLGDSITAYMSFMPSAFSLLLPAAFILCVLINKIKR